MRTRLLLILLAAAVAGTDAVYGQFTAIGIRAGAIAGAPYTPPDSGATGAPGMGMVRGIFARIRLNRQVAIQPELLWARKRAGFATPISGDTTIRQEVLPGVIVPITTFFNGFVEGEFDNLYLEFPVLLNYRWSERVCLQGGPYLAYLARGVNSGLADVVIGDSFQVRMNEPFDQSEYLSRADYGAVLGVQYETPAGLNVALRATYGLRSIYRDDYGQVDAPVRNIYVQATIGCALLREREDAELLPEL